MENARIKFQNFILGRLADMKGYREMTKEELVKAREELNARYEEYKALNLTLDMTRGKPSPVNQIPYDYTVEVRNRFKGLDLIDRVPDELWMQIHDIV